MRPVPAVFFCFCGLIVFSLFFGPGLLAQQSFYEFTVEDIHGKEL